MSEEIIAGVGGKDYKPHPLPKGKLYKTRCVQIIHMGTIEESYQGKTSNKDKVFITWELLDGPKYAFSEEKGKQRFVLSKEFTLSMSDRANLGKIVENWKGEALSKEQKSRFNVAKLLGKHALIQVIIKEKPSFEGKKPEKPMSNSHKMDISAIMPPERAKEWPKNENELLLWTYKDEFDEETFLKIPFFIREKMVESEEWKKYDYPSNALDLGRNKSGSSESDDLLDDDNEEDKDDAFGADPGEPGDVEEDWGV